MPKKPPRNAFYYYMIDFKEEQRKKGINYKNMGEVATAAGPVWTNVAPKERARYEAKAKAVKNKFNVPEQKFTSTGISLAEIEQMQREKREAEEMELQDIKNFVNSRVFNNRIRTENIYLMDINFYCKTSGEYLVGECTVLRFNLEDGIRDNYHIVINPGSIPIGYGYDVKLGSEEFGLPMPDEGAPRGNFMEILANIIDYLKQKDSSVMTLPAIYTMPEKVAPVLNFIQQMCSRAAEDDTLFRVYKLDCLFFTLVNAIKSSPNEGFPRESLALAQLKKDPFKYTPQLGCEMHELGEKSVECTKSRVNRWALTVLDSCCHLVGVNSVPGKHVPHDFDLAGILAFKDEKRAGSRVAGDHWQTVGGAGRGAGRGGDAWGDVTTSTGAGTSCNSTLNDSVCSGPTSSKQIDDTKKVKRTNPPLRMPTDFTPMRLEPAPTISSDADFPPLSLGAGRGRRNLSGELKKMNLNK